MNAEPGVSRIKTMEEEAGSYRQENVGDKRSGSEKEIKGAGNGTVDVGSEIAGAGNGTAGAGSGTSGVGSGSAGVGSETAGVGCGTAAAGNGIESTGSERVSTAYSRVSAVVSIRAVRENIETARRMIKSGTKLCAVIKADGYGHGAVPIAKALSKDGIDMFAVAIPEEGEALRKEGIEEPILLLGYTAPEQYEMLFDYDLTPTVFQYDRAMQLSGMAQARNSVKKIHIKIDTGMSRIGFADTDDSVLELKKIQELPGIEIEGIFTHFAKADESDLTPARLQLARFLTFVRKAEAAGIDVGIKHASNSAGIIELPEANLDMVRCGISTYGLYPSEEVEKRKMILRPAMQLKTHISYVKTVPAGTAVSYGGTYVADRPIRIATIPVGYADGYPRSLSNRGRVLIRGKYAPIRGRICMDQFMVDVTEIPEACQGDTVTLFGKDGEVSLPVEEPADLSGSFNYEFVCGISKRVPRVYSDF